MSSAAPRLPGFIARTFLWLPPCFSAWYFTAAIHTALGGALASGMLALFRDGLVEKVERTGHQLAFVTSVELFQAGQRGVMVAEVNALVYSYGLPLLAALALASGMSWRRAAACFALLLPFAALGIAADVLVQVVAQGPAVSGTAGLGGWRAEAIALTYQLSSMLLPALVPVVSWAASSRAYLVRMLDLESDPGGLPQPSARL